MPILVTALSFEASKDPGNRILVHQKDTNVAFPTQYRQALNDMTHRIADEVQRGQESDKRKMHSFYQTIT